MQRCTASRESSAADLSSRTDMDALPLVAFRDARVLRGGATILHVESFAWLPGEHWAVLGRNGAGKSTFLELIRGDIAPAQDQSDPLRSARSYCLDGVVRNAPGSVKQRIGLVSPDMQERYRRLESPIRGRELAASGLDGGPLLYRRPSSEEWARVDALLEDLGIAPLAPMQAVRMSQGQLRAVLVARALLALQQAAAGGHSLLLLDEVTQGLDKRARTRVLEVVERIAAGRDGPQLMLATHRPEEIPAGVGNALVIADGRLATRTTPAEAASLYAAQAPQAASCPHGTRLGDAAGTGEDLVRIDHCTVVREGVPVLHDASWRMTSDPHENWAVLGPNGAGKSTLLRLILGELPAAPGGSVRLPAAEASPPPWPLPEQERLGLWRRKRRLGFVSAELQARIEQELTVFDIVSTGFFGSLAPFDVLTRPMLDRVDAWLDHFGLDDIADKDFGALSTGLARRVLLARALVHDPVLLLLDEPCAGLDAGSREAFLSALAATVRCGARYIYVTHYPDDLPDSATHVLTLKQGRIVQSGPRHASSSVDPGAGESGAGA